MRPGEVYELEHEPTGKPRYVVVVSREELNRGSYVVVVPFTSKNFDVRRSLPNCVPFRAGEFGFERDCVAQAEQISKIPSDVLAQRPVFLIDDGAVARIARAIGDVIACRCEPA